jgi:hypothetical protein
MLYEYRKFGQQQSYYRRLKNISKRVKSYAVNYEDRIAYYYPPY